MAVLAFLVATLLAASASLTPAPPSLTPAPPPTPAPILEWEVVSRRAHDTDAFTQGLLLDEGGRLFESVGLWGESDVREVDPLGGAVLRRRALPERLFGEGLALVGDELIQLTWRAGLALRWDRETFELVATHRYEGQGWGLCFDGERLVMSDGSDALTFRDPHTFEVLGRVRVTRVEAPVDEINELECVGDTVWANVWKSDLIYRIDPATGHVTGVLELDGLLDPHPAEDDPAAVLNGIAWDERSGTFLVTGKRWPELIEIRLSPSG